MPHASLPAGRSIALTTRRAVSHSRYALHIAREAIVPHASLPVRATHRADADADMRPTVTPRSFAFLVPASHCALARHVGPLE
ncbi:UNVERIFIED_ORG: hypothetical protein ABIC54_005940 [Burkholderia sp. 1263]